jgi:Peptidase A4 family
MAQNESPGPVSFKVTPPDFDVTTAPQEELDSYGIPHRPDPVTEPDAFARWSRAFQQGFQLIQPELRRNPDHRHKPVSLVNEAAGTTSTWSGAVITPPAGKTFASVYAGWTVVPVWAYDAGTYHMSSWIGIDGYGGNDVLQAGIEHEVTEPGGKTTYYLWYEWYPDYEIQITNLNVKPGDEIHCTITSKSTTSASVVIGTNKLGVSINFNAPAGTTLQGNCAEWIVERPDVNNVPATLPHYQTVWFGSIDAYDGGGTVYDLGSNLTLLSMVDGAQTLSVPAEMDRSDLLVSFAALWQAAFQANTGNLWVAGTQGPGKVVN